EPDWQSVPPKDRNRWQRLAARTGGWVTPPNVVTIIGLIIAIYGLILIGQYDYWWGLALVAIGRLFDLVDGWLAARTGTKSPLGEVFDASSDKIILAVAIIVLPLAGLMPWFGTIILLILHAIISLISITARLRQYEYHSSWLGKRATAVMWFSLVVLFFGYALHLPSAHTISLIVTWILIAASAAIAASYVRQFKSASA
ncbi:MAG: phosphatidylglycerophosphate synthase, partial [Candidatus Saccharibacteria bacterium]|nr:phosphatidylglycerophosphate synthase [Candidatus Saccharibacteria bacterium]